MLDFSKSAFAIQIQVSSAKQLLLKEKPKNIVIVVLGDTGQRKLATDLAVYGVWANSVQLPEHKKNDESKPPRKIKLYGFADKQAFVSLKAQAEGNLLYRELTVTRLTN